MDVVLFSNYARKGEYTLVHNHNADLVAIYYVRTAASERPAVVFPDPDGENTYFAPEDGAWCCTIRASTRTWRPCR